MSLAFALMAAINGSTGSWATLSHGLYLPHQASPASAQPQPEATAADRRRSIEAQVSEQTHRYIRDGACAGQLMVFRPFG